MASKDSSEIKSILTAIQQSDVWELRRIFKQIGTVKTQKYLNEFWIAEGEKHAGYTLLHLSITSTHDVCKYLLQAGANPNQYDLHDNTPLHLASSQHKHMMMRLLLQHDADPSIKNLDDRLCTEMGATDRNRQQLQSLIDKCLNEKQELETISNLPFQNSDDEELKQIVSNLPEDAAIEHVLEIIVNKMNPEQTEQAPDTQQMVKECSTAFSDAGITTFAQLFLPAFQEWPLSVNVPVFVIHCLESIVSAWSHKLSHKVSAFTESTKIMDVLLLANAELKNKYVEKLPEYEAILLEQSAHSMKEFVQKAPSIQWDFDGISVDPVFSDTVKKIVNMYIVSQESNDRKHEQRVIDPFHMLIRCETVSCIISDDTLVHIATMDGHISVFDVELFGVFHEFQLVDTNNQTHIPSFMQFIDSNYEQLVTADKNGNVCCWYLHSKHPSKRAKCIRTWSTHRGCISGFGIPAQSQSVFTIGFDGYLRVRNLGYNGNITHSVQYSNGALTTMTFMSKTCVLIGTEHGVIMQIDTAKEKVLNVFRLNPSSPIRSLCMDKESDNKLCYFSFGDCSIGLLDISNDGEWQFVGKFVEGFDQHECTVNHLSLRNGHLWSCSEDGSIRIWELKFLMQTLEQMAKKKGKKTADSMPNCMKLGDAEMLSAKHENAASQSHQTAQLGLLEAWCLHKIDGMYANGVQRIHFIESASLMFATAYQWNVVAFDLKRIDDVLPEKQEGVTQRREQLNSFEKELQTIQQKFAEKAATAKTKKKHKGGKKKKK
eukprot:CAMPEP_0197034790 /NCGR_PEP_ID=MMETSP1384-20130603/12767_1 /TAXON_ID=29189 /ORGANISM="Ammonia sp." /LENGTH=769 /DNA_ID=CAMNT_0042464747 /DNA_START=38 /DNA_END=2347 /DNA_ORIENTATION=+